MNLLNSVLRNEQQDDPKEDDIRENYLIRNFSITSSSKVLGTISGLILDALVLFYFGLGTETDAFFAAMAIPLLIGAALEIQLPKVLVPMFSKAVSKREKESAFFTLSNFTNASTLFLVGLGLCGSFLAPLLMRIAVPGFSMEASDLSTRLSRVGFWLLPIRGASLSFQSVLYSHHRYRATSSVKFINNVVVLIFIVTLHSHFGIYAMALGYLAANVATFIVLFLSALRIGFKYQFVLDAKDPNLRKISALFAYALGGHAIGEGKALVENYLLSYLSSGSLSALRYAMKIVDSLSSILINSIVETTLPLVSHYASLNNLEEVKNSILKSIKLSIFVAMPICLWLIFAGKPLLVLFFQRGAFSGEQVALTLTLIMLLSPYLLLSRISAINQTIFYANRDTKTPAASAIITLTVSVAVYLVLMKRIGVYALPIGTSAASLCTAIGMSAFLHARYGALGWTKLKGFAIKVVGAALICAMALVLSRAITTCLSETSFINKVLLLAIPTFIGLTTYIISSIVFGLIDFKIYSLFTRNGRR